MAYYTKQILEVLIFCSFETVHGFVLSVHALHHLDKLFEIYFSVPVFVYLGNRFGELVRSVDALKLVSREQPVQLLSVDLAAAVLVEHPKGVL